MASNGLILGLTPRQALLLYVIVPVFLGFLSGWPQAGRTAMWPKLHAVGFWVTMSIGGWWLNDLATRLVALPLRRLSTPLWLLLLAGAIVAALPADMFFMWLVQTTHALFPLLPVSRPIPDGSWSLAPFLRTHAYGALVWPLINLACFHLLRMPRYGFDPPALAPEHPQTDPSAMIARLPVHLGGDILALEAEQHYLRVYTGQGSGLILYRLADAVRELGARGIQVHRSFWVARHAVIRVDGNPNSPKLVLRNGLEIPVSRSYRVTAQQAGLL